MSAWGAGLDAWKAAQAAYQPQVQSQSPAAQQTLSQYTFSGDTTGSGPNQGDISAPDFGQPIQTQYNSNLYASDQSAQDLAKLLGGKVISAPLREAGGGTAGSPWNTPNANYIVMPNGAVENAGTLASMANSMGGVGSKQFQTALSQTLAWDKGAATGSQGDQGEGDWYKQFVKPSDVPKPQQAAPGFDPAKRLAGQPQTTNPASAMLTGQPSSSVHQAGVASADVGKRFFPGQNPAQNNPAPNFQSDNGAPYAGNPSGGLSGVMPGVTAHPVVGGPVSGLPTGSPAGNPGGVSNVPKQFYPGQNPAQGNPPMDFQSDQPALGGYTGGNTAANPYGGGTGQGTPYTPPGVDPGTGVSAENPFGAAQADYSGNMFAPQMQAGGQSGADSWLQGQAQSGSDNLAGYAGGTNSMQQMLAQGKSPNQQALQGIVAGGGNPIDQLPAWQSMVKAQQRGIDEGSQQLQSQFDVGGNRFSTAFGTAATDYQNQATANQNALLGQMSATAGENAQSRLLNAGSTLAGIGAQGLTSAAGLGQQSAGQQAQLGFQGASQLSGQDYNSQMAQYNMGGQMAQYLAGGADQASSQLAELGSQAANTLYGGSVAGANSLFGGENSAMQGLYGGQMSSLAPYMQYLAQSQGQGNQAATDLSNQWNQNLQTGGQLGQQQYVNQQSQLNNQYQNWLYQQPSNNPLLSMMFSAATNYPQMYNPSYAPGALGSLLGGAGSLLGAAAGTKGLSDIRLKENIQLLGSIDGLGVYSYNFKGLPGSKIGMMAQEVYTKYPQAVIPGSEHEPWMIRPDVLSQLLGARN